MFGVMLQKMWHKKWMNICLLLGCILLTATVVSFPIYRTAAYDRMLIDQFDDYSVSEGKLPTQLTGNASVKKELEGKTITVMEQMGDYICDLLGVDMLENFVYLNLTANTMSSDTGRGDAKELNIKLGSIEGLDAHTKMLSGEMYSESGYTEDGAIECVVSQSCLVDKKLLVGEYFTFDNLRLPGGDKIRVYIKGIYDAADRSDYFWCIKPEKLSETILCNPAVFHANFTGENAHKYSLGITNTVMFDYNDLTASDVERIETATEYLLTKSTYKSVLKEPDFVQVLNDYDVRIKRINATLLILQIPILAMLATFLLMISGQMYEMEKNEISVIKSRGSSRFQIILLYFYQGLVITLSGGLIGLPLGALIAKLLGSTRNFLQFDFNKTLGVAYTPETFLYLGGAVLVCLLSITIPSIRHSKVTIVKLKQSKALRRKAWWEKFFLDIVLLGASLYGYYSFSKNGGNLSNAVMAGESMDPLLYISSSLFILGAGLFFLRIQPWLVRLIYLIGNRKWGPASYVSFMENIKNGRKQQLIMLFLIMTISLGMYHATVARTILQNAVTNTAYLSGCDVIIKEKWQEMTDRYGTPTGDYIAPDYAKYNSLEAAESYTRVIYDPNATLKGSDKSVTKITAMGISTKEFGSITMVDRSFLGGKHYYSYLNDLAVVEDGVLVSSNVGSKLGYAVGDSITFYNVKDKNVTCKIVGFIDYFPGYSPVENGLNPDGTAFANDNYLVVAHYDYLNNKWGTYPYEVWMKLKDGYSSLDVYRWMEDNDVSLSKFVDGEAKMNATLSDPLLQGTNGVLTMGFVVTIILCAVGYLIYWVMSIRERELIFGVLRASGLHKREIFHMLINEQIFSGLFSVLAGIGIGKLTSTLFVPILQQAYASENQALPMRLYVVASDMYKLYGVIALVMLTAIGVLIGILSRMNVTKALKLGEE
ncbi:MAG: ABC transporter permease [Lachnospiraceae bacterium]|nr:ABC transporter permease [Lachnospiraceae bacterium]